MTKTKLEIQQVARELCRRIFGRPDTVKVAFSSDFITGNEIEISVGANTWNASFLTDQATTQAAILDQVLRDENVSNAWFSGRDLYLNPLYNYSAITVLGSVTGGVSQPTVTVTTSEAKINPSVLYADQAMPSLPSPFATVRVMTISGVGHDYQDHASNDYGIIDIQGYRTASISVNYLGENALDECMKLYDYFETETCQSYLQSQDFGFVLKNNPQNLTNMLETDYEERSNIDFTLSFAASRSDKVGIIEKLVFEGEVDGQILDEIETPNEV